MMISKTDLKQLYVTGVDFEVPNPEDEDSPYLLHMKKLSPLEQTKAGKLAAVARVRKIQIKNLPDSDDLLVLQNEVDSMEGREGWTVFLVESELATRRVKNGTRDV